MRPRGIVMSIGYIWSKLHHQFLEKKCKNEFTKPTEFRSKVLSLLVVRHLLSNYLYYWASQSSNQIPKFNSYKNRKTYRQINNHFVFSPAGRWLPLDRARPDRCHHPFVPAVPLHAVIPLRKAPDHRVRTSASLRLRTVLLELKRMGIPKLCHFGFLIGFWKLLEEFGREILLLLNTLCLLKRNGQFNTGRRVSL